MSQQPAQLQSSQIQLGLPEPLLIAIDSYIQYGDTWDMETDTNIEKQFPDAPKLDATRASIIKFIMSAYSNKMSDKARILYSEIRKDYPYHKYITLRSAHPSILLEPKTRAFRLICAMVYMGIPIPGYFDGRKLTFDQSK